VIVLVFELLSPLAETRSVMVPWPGHPARGALNVTVTGAPGAIEVLLTLVMTAYRVVVPDVAAMIGNEV
jgi:hypothetical protein